MARAPSPFSTDPAYADIGASLGTALFGNPVAAQAQAHARAQQAALEAQAAENRAHATLYAEQTGGVHRQNVSSDALPGLVQAMFAPQPEVDPVGATTSYAPPVVNREEAVRRGLSAIIANAGQMQGDKINTTDTTSALLAAMGGENLSRSALIARGVSPSEHFAVTPERADAMAATAAAADLKKALGVATINNRDDVAVANANHATDYGVARINHASDIPVANIRAGGGTVALTGNNPGGINDGDFAKSQPGYVGANGRYAGFRTMADGENAHRALLKSYIARGFDTPAKISARWAPDADGNNSAGYAADIARTLGIGVNDQLTPADVDRFQLAQGTRENGNYRGRVKPVKPTTLKPADVAGLDAEIKRQLAGVGDGQLFEKMTPQLRLKLRTNAANAARSEGNPVTAVTTAIRTTVSDFRADRAKAVPGARRAPDGKYYVQRGTKSDGSPAYFEVK